MNHKEAVKHNNRVMANQDPEQVANDGAANPINALEFEQSLRVGDTVLASFTNTGHVKVFEGRIVGKTKNYWKVESLAPVWAGEAAGRVFQIATFESRIWSANNRIVERVQNIDRKGAPR